MTTNLIFAAGSYSWETTLGIAIVCFFLGFIFKSAVVFKQRKKILKLEDEMLDNHSRILALEKRLAENKAEIITHRATEREIKVS